jgi:hypothetical protein
MKTFFQKLLLSISLRPRFAVVIVISFVIASCAPSTETSENIWSPLTASTAAQNANGSDCFVEIELVPGKTSKQNVEQLWGKPLYVERPGGPLESWEYRSPREENILSRWKVEIHFNDKDSKVYEVWFDVSKCTLGDVIDVLGPPEVLELFTLASDMIVNGESALTIYVSKFHYPSKGFMFEVLCTNTREKCLKYSPNEKVVQKRFYERNVNVEGLPTFTYRSKIIEWTGFDK